MLWCLHGFLGRGRDWDGLRASWPTGLLPIRTPDLFGMARVPQSLEQFGLRFAKEVCAQDLAPLLLGYSLGGRLALHALLARPAAWRGAIIVSAHLGLPGETDRADRLAADAAWARRFRAEPWDRVLADWNARDVFGGRSQTLDRPESAFDRAALAHGLEAWSLGNQADLADRLAALTQPILWIAGADDPPYVAQAELAARHGPTVRVQLAPGVGHRVPWEAPEWFANTVAAFVGEVVQAPRG